MKMCPKCKTNEKSRKDYCSKCYKEMNKEWYKNNREHKINITIHNLKINNYAYEKTPEQRILRNIKKKTRTLFPILQDTKCYYCGGKATEHHHYTQPIEYDKFYFVCHNCHIEANNAMKGGLLIISNESKDE